MSKDHDLRMVRIGCFSGNIEGGNVGVSKTGTRVTTVFLELDADSIKYITCIIDNEKQLAIDIFTGDCYHIIQRDECDRIIEPQEDIKTNTYYALQVGEETLKTESQLYNLYLNYMATRAQKEYNKNGDNGYQLKITNKKKN